MISEDKIVCLNYTDFFLQKNTSEKSLSKEF